MKKIKKVVLPVAGLGTRVMPLTLHQPKGMISVVDKPVIHYVIDELITAGVEEVILIISPNQHQFEKYFSYLAEKDREWKKIKFRFIVQEKPAGNGDAVFLAKNYIKDEPFLVVFGDDLLDDKKPPMRNLVGFFRKLKSPVLILETVPKKDVSRYGVVDAKKIAKDLYEINDIVEKPKADEAPSNLIIIGRYVLTPPIFKEIEKLYSLTPPGREVYLADALKNYIKKGNKMYGWQFRGHRFDCGSKIGILKAQAYFGLRHPEIKKEFKKYLKTIR